MTAQHGQLILFGSGETARHGRQVQEEVLKALPIPVRVAILETPSGFQANASHVIGKLSEFVAKNLQNYKPQISTIGACHRGGPGDPDDPAVYASLNDAHYLLAGPGSPTYTVRQLAGTATWEVIRQRWGTGMTLAFASAAAISLSTWTLPVYEIYKVGDDPHWLPGLDLLGHIGLEVAIVPHWNNAEGGANLDTTHCFMSADRFAQLRQLLPPTATILGIDEHTSCIIDVNQNRLAVRGQSQITILRGEREIILRSGDEADLSILGEGVLQPHLAAD